MAKYNRSLSQYLETPEAGGLGGLLQHVNYLQQLTPLLNETLPLPLPDHCTLANYRQGRLIIAVSNQAIATRLRFLLPDLRQQLRKHPIFAGLVGIDFYITKPIPNSKVSTLTHPVSRQPAQLRQISRPSAPIIADEALSKQWQQLLQLVYADG